MSQKKVDTQPSALLMLSSEEMSFSLLGGLNDNNVPSLLAIPQEPPNSSAESASHLFLTDADVDNFIGQTSASPGPVSTASQQKSLSTTISSFLPNPFSTPLLGTSHPPNIPPPSSNQSYTSSVSLPPPGAYQNMLANNSPHPGGDDAGNGYQYRRAGKYQHVPAPNYYSPPPQPPPHFGMMTLPRQHQAAPARPPPYAPPPYGQPPPSQEQTVLYGLNDHHKSFLPNSAFYRPIESHWFYTKKIGDKTVWMPFSYADSGRLEETFNGGDQNNRLVAVEGGRYDVDIPGRLKKSVYWEEEEDAQVRRCSWFYRPEGDSHFVPYDEKIAAGLEESYKYAVQNSDFHKRLAFPSGETIIIHSPTAIVHYPPSSQPDAWGNAMGDSRPQVVRRGVTEFENIPKDESEKVDHLVLIVLGFNYKAKKIVECVDEFRQIAEQMMTGHFSRSIKDGQVGRVEFLPVIWSHDHLLDDITDVDKVLKTLTLTSIGKLRHFTNEMLVELMFYTSPSHAQKAVTFLTEALNHVYSTFEARHAEFNKGVSVVGHGVGSVILYDILANQGEDSLDLHNTDQSASPEQARFTSGQNVESVNQAGLKRSLNDSSSSLASLAESDRMSTLGINSTLEDVLEKLGLKEYEEKFKSEQIDVSSLVLLNESDIKEIGLPLGPRKKLQEFIKKNLPQNATGGDVPKPQQKQLAPLPTMQQQQQNNLVEDASCTPGESSRATFTFSVKSHQDGCRGTDVLVLKYCPLKFELANFFALGSPVAMVLALRGVKLLGEDFRLPTCLGYYNIFHPFDPLAYRMEPLVLPSVPQKAVLIPHHKGRKRFHLELKENLARIGFDIKQRIMESFRSTWRTINNFAYGHKANPPEPKINDEDVDREVNSVLTEMQKEADDAGSVVASSVADDSDFPVGSLNQGRRVDYVLQEKPTEIFSDYIFALASSSCYWQSEDTALMLLKEIYLSMGIVSQKPGMPPMPGLPLGPPPKSGFVQSSALTKGNNPVAHASPYPFYPSQPPQMQSYQQPHWSNPDTGSLPIGPPLTNPISSFASQAPPPTTNQMPPPPSQKLPPPTTGQIISSLSSNQNHLPPPTTSQMFSSVSYNQAMPPPSTNQKLPPPPTNQMFSSVSYNQAMPLPSTNQKLPPPPTNQMFSPVPSSQPPPPMMTHPSFHPGGYAHHPPPPAYGERGHQMNYPAGPGAMRPPHMGLANMPLGPPPPQKDFAKLD